MHLRVASNRGLTLVEMMIAIVVGAIVLLAVSFALSATHKMAMQARDYALMRQDIRAVTVLIRRSIRPLASEEVSIQDDGERLVLSPAGGGGVTLKKVDGDFVREAGGETDIVLGNRLSELEFELVPGLAPQTALLRVTLTVALHDMTSTASFTTAFRNESET